MDDSAQLQSPIPNPAQAAITVPAYRRRPIRSRTYQTLLQILSLCPVASAQGDLGCVETRSGDDEIGVISHDESNRKESEERIQETSIDKSKEVVVKDGSFLDKQTTVLDFGQEDNTINGEHVSNQMNTVEVQEIENQSGNNDAQIANKMKCGGPIPVDDFNAFDGHLKMDEEFSIDDFSEVLGSIYMDMADKTPKAGGEYQNNGSMLDENMPKETDNELWMKELELEELISNPGTVELSAGPTANNEIEEGEISEETEVSIDSLSEISPEKVSTEVVHDSGDHHIKEDITDDEKRGREQQDTRDSASEGKSKMMVEMRTAPDYNFIYGFEDGHTTTQIARPLVPSVESSMASGRVLLDHAAENQISSTAEKDDNSNKKKRKKGPLTEERKAKKKKKERMKRAEKNRQLGVNRLKLQTVLKPKKIAYCRHYLQGRCHEGEKCKFSHDTVPLTKSKPCGYFARNSCMKGDDCPFDHELSKYPCNNYVTTGYCNRGSSCLFSHEMPANHSQSKTPNISKPKLKPEQQMFHKDVSLVASKVAKMNSDNNHSNKTDAKSCSIGNSPPKGTEQLVLENAQKTALRPPKGINLLVNEQTPPPPCDRKPKQDASSVMASNVVNASLEEMSKAPIRSNMLNENKPESAAPRRPRGINFLTFAQPLSDDSRNKMLSDLVSSSSNESLKLVIGESSRGERRPSSSLQETDGQSKDSGLKKQNGNSTVPIMSSDANIVTPLADLIKETNRVGKITMDDQLQAPSPSYSGSWDQLTNGDNAKLLRAFEPSVSLNTPSSVRNAVQSTLAFAEKFDASIKLGSLHRHSG